MRLLHGDCREVMASLPECSVDAIVCDPPYGLEFMGKQWDKLGPLYSGGNPALHNHDRPVVAGNKGAVSFGAYKKMPRCRKCGKYAHGNEEPGKGGIRCKCPEPDFDHRFGESGYQIQAWHETWAKEALRVLKPGGHMVAFSAPRTYHRMACAIEDAGFEIRDSLMWLFGSGFPKSLDVSKALDKQEGAMPIPTGDYKRASIQRNGAGENWKAGAFGSHPEDTKRVSITAPATDLAREWEGWGTALKPAYEPIVLARKPLQGTVAGNVARWGTGGLNIDATRIGTNGGTRKAEPSKLPSVSAYGDGLNGGGVEDIGAGRWPANVLLDDAVVPTVRLKYNTSNDVRLLLEDWCDARNQEMRSMPGIGFRPAKPGETNPLLLEGVLRGVDEREHTRGESPNDGQASHARIDSEDESGKDGERQAGQGRAGVEGWPSLVEGLRDDQPQFATSSRAGGIRVDGNLQRSAISAGTPPDYGATLGESADAGGSSTSPQWSQGRQPDRESGDLLQRVPLEGTQGNRPRVEDSEGGERTPTGSARDVLLSDVPDHWLTFFEYTGDVALLGSARLLDAMSGERPGMASQNDLSTYDDRNEIYGKGIGNVEPGFREGFNDRGGASRFFYTAKSSRREREFGLDDLPVKRPHEITGRQEGSAGQNHPRASVQTGARRNDHPTVKPVDLMRWLCRLITPPNGTILDPFMGSGSTGMAALDEGFRFIGIDMDEHYIEIARRRIARRHVLEPLPQRETGQGVLL